MALVLADIGDAIVAAVQGVLPAATVERLFLGKWQLGSVTGFLITVMPRTQNDTLAATKKDKNVYRFEIIFRKKLASADPTAQRAEIDLLLEDVQSVKAALNREVAATAKWNGNVRHEPLFNPIHILKWQQFTSVVSLEYDGYTIAGV